MNFRQTVLCGRFNQVYGSAMFRCLVCLLLLSALVSPVAAQPSGLSFFNMEKVTTCPASMSDLAPPDFASDTCKQGIAEDIDPQGTLQWVRTTVPLASTRGRNGEPLSLYISGKMSSEVYLNGEHVGANGVPGADKASETPGKMDAEFFPPQSLFRVGDNDVVLRASSHHGVLHLHRPVHLVGIAPSGIYTNGKLPRFGLALVTLGVFLLGGFYFGVMAVIGASRTEFATLSLICFFAGGQLVSETLRVLVAYDYPVHDLRLLAIALFSSAFGLSVAFHIFRTFMKTGLLRMMLGLAGLCGIALVSVNGFDYKALASMSIPLTASLFATGIWTYQRRARAYVYFVALLMFLAAIGVFQGLFLDTVFFLLVAFFLLLLFIEQALTLAEEARERRSEEARANRLEQALAEAEERTETNHISVKSAGKMERIATSQIIHCQGASGYSEIVLVGGRTVLHAASLNEMEDTLPATFLRVHRSHLINVMCVASLSRDPSGTGTLTLSEGAQVPVSRRVMPKVRQALG